MRRALVIVGVAALSLTAAAPALAVTQTASAGIVSAKFTFTGRYPSYHQETLTISRAGAVLYSRAVASKSCFHECAPGVTVDHQSSVHVLDLEHNGEPDVVLDLYSGGAHCCSIEQIFSFDPGTMTYVKAERNFGDPGERIVDLDHNGRFEFLTADDSFAYEFTDFAASGLPIEILTFEGGHFVDVTGHYPALVAKDAGRWLRAFKGMSREHYQDSVGVIAAWAADEDRLGHERLVARYLVQQARAGHLNSALSPQEPGGRKFVAKLQRFLRAHGYVG